MGFTLFYGCHCCLRLRIIIFDGGAKSVVLLLAPPTMVMACRMATSAMAMVLTIGKIVEIGISLNKTIPAREERENCSKSILYCKPNLFCSKLMIKPVLFIGGQNRPMVFTNGWSWLEWMHLFLVVVALLPVVQRTSFSFLFQPRKSKIAGPLAEMRNYLVWRWADFF